MNVSRRGVLLGSLSLVGATCIPSATGLVRSIVDLSSPEPSSILSIVDSRRISDLIKQHMKEVVGWVNGEVNDDYLRNEVTQISTGFFNTLVSKQVVYDYRVVCNGINNSPDVISINGFRWFTNVKFVPGVNKPYMEYEILIDPPYTYFTHV